MSAKWITPAWTGPDSPQGPVRIAGQCEFCKGTIQRGVERGGRWFCCQACATAFAKAGAA